MATQTSSTDGCVLRIGNTDLETQVFNIGKYYSESLIDTLHEEAENRQVA